MYGFGLKGGEGDGSYQESSREEPFATEKRSSAEFELAGHHGSETGKFVEALVGPRFPSHKRNKNPNIFFYHQITLKTHGVRRAGAAALDLCNVACGRFDGFWEFNLNPWDTAAGVLIVEEAGGRITRFDGSPFELNSRETLASNGLLHPALLAEFKAVFEGRGLDALPDPREYKR